MVLHYNLLVVGYLVLYKYAEASVKIVLKGPKAYGIRIVSPATSEQSDFDPTSFVPAAKKTSSPCSLLLFPSATAALGSQLVLPCGRRFSKREISILTTLCNTIIRNYIIQVG